MVSAMLFAPQSALATVTWSNYQPAQGSTVASMPLTPFGAGVSAVCLSSDTQIAQDVADDCTVDGDSYVAYGYYLTATSQIVNGVVSTDQLSDGPHTVIVGTHLNSTGFPRQSTTWSFNLQAPPVLGSPVPANNWISSVARPTIGLTTNENGPGLHQVRIRLSIDGSSVFDGWVNEGPWTWTPPSDFADNTTHNVAATVTDASNNTSSLFWSFSVAAPSTMHVGGSCARAGCHETFPAAHPMDNCEACHSYGSFTDPGPDGELHDDNGNPALIQGPPAPAGPCLNCHEPHIDHSPAARLTDCASCHNASWPGVPQHDDASSAAQHIEHVRVRWVGLPRQLVDRRACKVPCRGHVQVPVLRLP